MSDLGCSCWHVTHILLGWSWEVGSSGSLRTDENQGRIVVVPKELKHCLV